MPILEVGPNVTSFADTTLFPITTYTYRVRAFNLDGYSFYSNPAAATTLQQGPPPAPTNLVATSQLVGVKAKVKLTWQDNSTNENTFEVERCKGSTCTNFAVIGAVSVNETLYTRQAGRARHDLPLPGQGHVKRGLLRLLEHCDDDDAVGMKHLEINEEVSLLKTKFSSTSAHCLRLSSFECSGAVQPHKRWNE